jgi:branched-chain amino acid aminotransferase
MQTLLNMNVEQVAQSRIAEVNWNDLVYGKYYADHMFVVDYENGKWGTSSIVPFGPMSLSPTISALHYGQSIFEGLKAYRSEDGEVSVFRYLDNYKRMVISAERMGMPHFPESFFSEGLMELLKLDKAWAPKQAGCSLYIRPVMFATDTKVGVHSSESYKFVIFTTPVGLYFPKPLRTLAEKEYVRSAQGGVGYAKAAGNYGGAMYPSILAKQKGYDQIIWLDASEHKNIEEAGTMNIMMVIDGKLITPALSNTTLAGVTRDSVLTIARSWNIPVEERKIGIDEVVEAHKKGTITEVFGVGTAATVAHIQVIAYNGVDYEFPPITDQLLSTKIAKHLGDIRYNRTEDTFNWMTRV